ncbi:hypothetical protein [Mycobacterium aquaticum]|uniref:hypothetical protein n=1 Tax=Mycobacterium aquaticum TaxID=1927124 RepID=UPI001154B98A|nr:hypothetical protein [Mycobacterium aquaticum]
MRRVDAFTYLFVEEGHPHGYPSYRRMDLDIWCRRLPDFGWVVCDAAGTVSSRPFDDAGQGERPPAGVWVSRKGDRSSEWQPNPQLPQHESVQWCSETPLV